MKNIILPGITIYLFILVINIFGVYIYNKKSPRITSKVLLWYLIFLLIFQILTTTLALLNVNSLIFSHAYFIIQCSILAFFFSQIIRAQIAKKIIKYYAIGALSFLFIQYLLFPSLIWSFNLAEVFITNYLIILLSLLYFYENLGEKKKFQPFVIGVLIYSSLSTIIFLFGNVASIISIDIGVALWLLNIVVLIVYQILISGQWYSFLKKKKHE